MLYKFRKTISAVTLILLSQAAISKPSTFFSSDAKWRVTIDSDGKMRIGETMSMTVSIGSSQVTPVDSKCPEMTQVILQMPQHGHGAEVSPTFTKSGFCAWQIANIIPSMIGSWRLRMVFNIENVLTVVDSNLEVVAD